MLWPDENGDAQGRTYRIEPKKDRDRFGWEVAAFVAAVVVMAGLAFVWVRVGPAFSIALTVIVAIAGGAIWRWEVLRRRHKLEPHGAGWMLGRVGESPMHRGRPYVITWQMLRQHMLALGPTGVGKTMTVLRPLLDALWSYRASIFYLNGKVDDDPHEFLEMGFDYVFAPGDAHVSACWSPLGGSDPYDAARIFAGALYADEEPNFYTEKAQGALRAVIPALWLTSPRAADGKGVDAVRQELVQFGFDDQEAAKLLFRHDPETLVRGMSWVGTREGVENRCAYLKAALREGWIGDVEEGAEKEAQPGGAPGRSANEGEPTIIELYGALFSETELKALEQRCELASLSQLSVQLRSLLDLRSDERAAMLANLESKLSLWLSPPFDRLCATSDFTLRDIHKRRRIAFLIPTGAFPDETARLIGRVAVAQFQSAVRSVRSPELPKIALLDEFHSFVGPGFAPFLSEARSNWGAAVMILQSVAQLDASCRHEILNGIGTLVALPGQSPEDAEYLADLFGRDEDGPEGSYRAPYRFTQTKIQELDPRYVLVRGRLGARTYPVAKVRVRRRA